jgi:ubiquinone/menaquinone biosynthesis C-methylase UbiE
MNLKHETQVMHWFDKWSKSRTFKRLSPWLASVQEHILSMIDWTKVSGVLDIGCGSGNAVYAAAERLDQKNGGIACGCDISTGMLQEGLSESAKSASTCFLCASAQGLPFRENSFEVVLSTVAFHHFPIPHLALKEFRRVLRAEGKVLIADMFRDISVKTWVFDRLHRWFEKGHVKYYRTDEMLLMLRNAGFKNIELSKINPSFSDTKKISGSFGIFSATNPR